MIDGMLQPDGAATIVEDQGQILKLQRLDEFPKDAGVLIEEAGPAGKNSLGEHPGRFVNSLRSKSCLSLAEKESWKSP